MRDPEKARAYQKAYRAAHRPALLAYFKKRYEDNKSEILAGQKEYYYKNHTEIRRKQSAYAKTDKYRAGNRRRYHSNPEITKRRVKAWQSKNRAKSNGYKRIWAIKNPDVVTEIKRRRRARILEATVYDFDIQAIRDRIDYYEGLCAYCSTGVYEHLDHVIALARGGPHCPANFRPACAACNLSKGDKPLYEWLASRK